MPLIATNPDLGLTESVTAGRAILDERTASRGYPYIQPNANGMVDDAHRLNHALKMLDEDMDAMAISGLTGIPLILLLPTRP